MLIKSNLPKEQYLKEVNQDLLIPVLTIHDEVNLIINKHLVKPLLKKIISIGAAKNVINSFGIPYMNFLYDAEYDSTHGTFTGEGFEFVDGYSPYQIPKSKLEHKAYKDFNIALDLFKKEETPIIELDYEKFTKILQIKIKKYHTKEKGFYLVINKEGKKFKYQSQLKETFKRYLK